MDIEAQVICLSKLDTNKDLFSFVLFHLIPQLDYMCILLLNITLKQLNGPT